MRRAKGARSPQSRPPIGQPSTPVDTCRLDGLSEGHIRQDGGKTARQHECTGLRIAEHEKMMNMIATFALLIACPRCHRLGVSQRYSGKDAKLSSRWRPEHLLASRLVSLPL